jgi:hypothetical protein
VTTVETSPPTPTPMGPGTAGAGAFAPGAVGPPWGGAPGMRGTRTTGPLARESNAPDRPGSPPTSAPEATTASAIKQARNDKDWKAPSAPALRFNGPNYLPAGPYFTLTLVFGAPGRPT